MRIIFNSEKEELELDQTHTIYLNDTKTLSVDVNFFDANHCPGT